MSKKNESALEAKYVTDMSAVYKIYMVRMILAVSDEVANVRV